MRPLAVATLLLASLTAGCASDDPTLDQAAPDQPMALQVLDADQVVGRCNNAFRDQDVLVLRVLLTNQASVDVGPPEYDVAGMDEEGEAYPMCWPDEPVVRAGRSLEMDLRFYVTDEDCDVLHELVVRQLFAGAWTEARVPTGLKDPC